MHGINVDRTGVLLNPGSGSVVKHVEYVQTRAKKLGCDLYAEVSGPDQIKAAVQSFESSGVNLLIIIGGDGTVQSVISHYLTLGISPLPRFIVLPAGTTNMTARDLGMKHSMKTSLKQLSGLMQGNRQGRLVSRPVLRIRRQSCPDIYGMFFGMGIIAQGVEYFQAKTRGNGLTGEKASLPAVLACLGGLITGKMPAALPRTSLYLVDDGRQTDMSCLLLFVSTLDRLLFGLKPYWGTEVRPLHVTCIKEDAKNLLLSMCAVIFNRGNRLTEDRGYFSCNQNELVLDFSGRFIVDGEIFHTAEGGDSLKITSTIPVEFMIP